MNTSLTGIQSKIDVAAELRGYISLFKPKIIALLAITAVTSAIVAAAGTVPWMEVSTLTIAGILAAGGSACLNNYFDRDVDAVMGRTKARPLPAGKVGAPTALSLGLSLTTIAVLLSTRLNYWVTFYMLAGSLVYVVIYTVWLKRKSWLNIVIGGLAGSFAVLAGWAAIDPQLSVTPLAMASVVFLWTPHHFWSFALAYKEEYGRARLPMLPVLVGETRAAGYMLASTSLLVLVSLVPYLFGALDLVYLVLALISGGLLLASAIALQRRPTKEIAWQNFKVSGLYLAVLFVAMLMDVLI